MIVPADKTRNHYKMDPETYNKLVHENITKVYKKSDPKTINDINTISKNATDKLGLSDRMFILAEKEAFITMKDHKENFQNNPKCRLINPAKPEIGKISKAILEKLNKALTAQHSLNQWRSTKDVLRWFNNLADKQSLSFICFDIVDFYPSIKPELLEKALSFAVSTNSISEEEKSIIMLAKQSVLVSKGNVWQKQGGPFDVTMGSFDGAETCELVGCYILSILSQKFGNNIGLYRDDGLAALNATPFQIDKIKKDICKTFKDIGLKITIEANLKIVNYLDVTLNLNTGVHNPYKKPNDQLIYVHSQSNHPPAIIQNIPSNINNRLCSISSNRETFNKASPEYQQALDRSGYTEKLEYKEATTNPQKRRHKRNITWYNPPFSMNVKTNIGKKFIHLIRTSFPKKHVLHKILNTNTVKISYSCMNNMQQIIDKHNKNVNHQPPVERGDAKKCNCRNPAMCPLEGNCLATSMVYQATVTSDNDTQTYIGLTERTFKARYNNHTASFRNNNLRNSTELSKHIWYLKDNDRQYTISWKIIKHAKAFNNKGKRCNLCLCEKLYIIYHHNMASLNKRSELLATCRHQAKFLLNK
jgi:hypothetical protein